METADWAGRSLAVQGLTVDYGSLRAVDGVDLEFRAGEVHCLLGANGSGKSTVLRALSGVVPTGDGLEVRFDDGSTFRRLTTRRARAAGLRFVHQDRALVPELSIRENVFLTNRYPRRWLHVDWHTARRRTAAILDRLGVAAQPGDTVGRLSDRDRVLVATARALLQLPASGGYLFVDEPTATLDETEANSLLTTLADVARSNGVGVCLVTHRLREVQAFSDRVTVLRRGRVVLGAETADVDTGRLLAALGASGSEPPDSDLDQRTLGAQRLALQGVAGRSLRGIDLSVHAGEVVGVTGVEGSGHEEVAEIVHGLSRPLAGRLLVDGVDRSIRNPRQACGLGIGLVPARRIPDGGIPELSVGDNVLLPSYRAYSRRGWFRRRRARHDADRIVRAYGVDPPQTGRIFGALSGGNQQKAIVGRWLSAETRLLVLAEPTAGIDPLATRTVYARLRESVGKGLAVLLISSDVEELAEVCDRVVVLVDGEVGDVLARPDITPERLVRASFADPAVLSVPAAP